MFVPSNIITYSV